MTQPFADSLKEPLNEGEPANEKQKKAIASKFDAAVADLRNSRELFNPMRRNASLKRAMEEFLRGYPGYYKTLHDAIGEKPTLCDSEVLTRLHACAGAPAPMRAEAAPMRAEAAPMRAAPPPGSLAPPPGSLAPRGRALARAGVLDKYPVIAELMMRAATVYLDIGCADGSITAAIAGKLELEPGRALACDIVDRVAPDARKSIQFELSSATKLPYADASVDLITMHMVAHHFRVPRAIFYEARRVSRGGALLLLREHDPPPRDLEAITERLNIEHALWACMINKEQTPEEFLDDYRAPAGYANYRPLAAFIDELGAVGFHCIGRNGPRPGDKNYAAYALFKAADKNPVCASTDSLSSSAP